MKSKKVILATLCLGAGFAFAACGTDPAPGGEQPRLTITLDRTEVTMTADSTLTLTAMPGGYGESKYLLTYASSDESVVSVENGELVAHKKGVASITVKLTAGGEETTAVCEVTVTGKTPIVDVTTTYSVTYEAGLTLADVAELDEGYSWKESGSTTLHAGENQSFTLVYTPENPDKYDTVEIPVTVNVEKGSWNLRTTEKVSGGSFTYYYEAAAVDFSALGLFEYVDGADVSYQLSKNGAVVTETIVPVGVYGLTASIAGTDDYNPAEKTIEFRIELTAMQAFIAAVDDLDENAANVSEKEKLTVANAYKNLSAEEKNQIVESWGVTVSAKYGSFVEQYVNSVAVQNGGKVAYYGALYGENQIDAKTDIGGTAANVGFTVEKSYAEEEGSLHVTTSADTTTKQMLVLSVKNPSATDLSGKDGVFTYIYNNISVDLTMSSWPTGVVLESGKWTLVSIPAECFGIANKGLPAKDNLGALSFKVTFYNGSLDNLAYGADLYIGSWTFATPEYVNGLISALDKSNPDQELVAKIVDVYRILSAASRELVTGYEEVEALYKAALFDGVTKNDATLVYFSSKAGLGQITSGVQYQAMDGAKKSLVPESPEAAGGYSTKFVQYIGSLYSYYRYEIRMVMPENVDLSGYDAVEFYVKAVSSYATANANGMYYLDYAGATKVGFTTGEWVKIRIPTSAAQGEFVLRFYTWNTPLDRAAIGFRDELYLTDIKAVRINYKAEFIAMVDALGTDYTAAEVAAVSAYYETMPASAKEDSEVAAKYASFRETYIKKPALATLKALISAAGDAPAREDLEAVVAYYGSLEESLQNDTEIKAAYDAFYENAYRTIVKADFLAKINAITKDSDDEEKIDVIRAYRSLTQDLQTDAEIKAAYESFVKTYITDRLDSNCFVQFADPVIAYYQSVCKVVLATTGKEIGGTITLSEGERHLGEASLNVKVGENWTANSALRVMPQIKNETGKAIKIFFYFKADTQARRCAVYSSATSSAAWEGKIGENHQAEKGQWQFVSFELPADRYFYLDIQWWKDANGSTKYMIGYAMDIMMTSVTYATPGYVSGLIEEYNALTDETAKAELKQKINDVYGILSETEKAAVVGYDTLKTPEELAEEFAASVTAITAESTAAEKIAILDAYRGLSAEVRENESAKTAYESFVKTYITDRLDSNCFVQFADPVIAYYQSVCKVVLATTGKEIGGTITLSEGERHLGEASLNVKVGENWTANSALRVMPQIKNETGKAIKIFFYFKADTQARRCAVYSSATSSAAWEGKIGENHQAEKGQWQFVSFELPADRYFYLDIQWWKDANGSTKYMIGYAMDIMMTSVTYATPGYVSGLIEEYNALTDETAKAELKQKINDVYGILSETEKAAVVGYEAWNAAANA